MCVGVWPSVGGVSTKRVYGWMCAVIWLLSSPLVFWRGVWYGCPCVLVDGLIFMPWKGGLIYAKEACMKGSCVCVFMCVCVCMYVCARGSCFSDPLDLLQRRTGAVNVYGGWAGGRRRGALLKSCACCGLCDCVRVGGGAVSSSVLLLWLCLFAPPSSVCCLDVVCVFIIHGAGLCGRSLIIIGRTLQNSSCKDARNQKST